ncbi:MAG: 50S ribosomal protein L17 [Bacteroidales bacterium]|nr:50S ribosomal protein L17 [Bacteroidales bacterium]
MRHRNKNNNLSRTASHRKAMLANMATSLVMHKRIKTTLAKAKVLRTYIEPIITKAKNDTTHNRRTAFRYFRDKYAVSELFRTIAPKVGDRPGGYTRILKIGHRVGDNAEICYIELVDFNTTYAPNEKSDGKKRRSRRGKKTSDATQEVLSNKVEEVKPDVEEIVENLTEEITNEVEEIKEENKEEDDK